MRGAPTDAELRLWRLLRDRRLNGIKFRRQVPLGPYIVDFLCVGAKLIVEADGSQHAESRRDTIRDTYLASHGWKVLRFWNNEVVQNREGVLETIVAHAGPSSVPSGHLLPEGEGEHGTPPSPKDERLSRTPVQEPLLPRGEGGAPKGRRIRATNTEPQTIGHSLDSETHHA
jgi:very-short-patch-repair endonuclease